MKFIKIILLFLLYFPAICQENQQTIIVIVKDNFGNPLRDIELTLVCSNASTTKIPIRTGDDGSAKKLINKGCLGGTIELNSNSKYRLSSSQKDFELNKYSNIVTITLIDEKKEFGQQIKELNTRLDKNEKELIAAKTQKNLDQKKIESLLDSINRLRATILRDSLLLVRKDARLDSQDSIISSLNNKVSEIEKTVKELLSRIITSQEKLFNAQLEAIDFNFESYDEDTNTLEFSFKLSSDTSTNYSNFYTNFYLDEQIANHFGLELGIEIEQIDNVKGTKDEKGERNYRLMQNGTQTQQLFKYGELKYSGDRRFTASFTANNNNKFHRRGLNLIGVSYIIYIFNKNKIPKNTIINGKGFYLLDFNTIINSVKTIPFSCGSKIPPQKIPLSNSISIELKDVGQYNDAVRITLDTQVIDMKLGKEFDKRELQLNTATDYCLKITSIQKSEGTIYLRIEGTIFSLHFSRTHREHIIHLVKPKE